MTAQSLEPVRQFRGCWAPAELFHLLEEGKINSRDFITLLVIDSLCKARGEGCWASNAYLAKMTGVESRWVRKIISKLRKMELLKEETTQIPNGSKRILFTAWSYVEERVNNCSGGEGLKALGGRADRPPNNTNTNVLVFNRYMSAVSEQPTEEKKKMPFMDRPISPDKRTATPSPVHFRFAEQLRAIVVGHTQQQSKYSKTSWAKEFTTLLQEINGVEERVTKVLQWYSLHIKDDYVPQCFSAKTFRAKFTSLEQAMTRKPSSKKPTALPPTAEGQRLTDRLSKLGWPALAKQQMNPVIEASFVNYTTFFKKLRGVFPPDEVPSVKASMSNEEIRTIQLHQFAAALSQTRKTPFAFLEEWFHAVKDRIDQWEEWNGNLWMFAFDITNKHTKDYLAKWSERHQGTTGLKKITRVLEAIT